MKTNSFIKKFIKFQLHFLLIMKCQKIWNIKIQYYLMMENIWLASEKEKKIAFLFGQFRIYIGININFLIQVSIV